MWKTVSIFLDRFFALVGALAFAQIPQYYQQYILSLSGHIGELSYQVNSLNQIANQANKTLPQYIQKFLESSDNDFQAQGVWMQALVTRLEKFTNAFKDLQESSPFLRPFKLLWDLDLSVAKETCNHFTLGFVFNLETFFYLVVGLFFGYFLYRGIVEGLRRIFSNQSKIQK